MSDLSIMLEWAGFPLDPAEVFLGLAPDVALGAVWRRGITGEDLQALKGVCIRAAASGTPGVCPLLPQAAGDYFAAEQIIPAGDEVRLDPGYSVLVVNEGTGTLAWERSEPAEVAAGQVYLVPYAAGAIRVRGHMSAIRCYPAV